MATKKTSPKGKSTKRTKAATPPPPAPANPKDAASAPGVKPRGRVVDGDAARIAERDAKAAAKGLVLKTEIVNGKERSRWVKKAQEAAAQQGPPRAPKRHARPRIALVNKDDTAEITTLVQDLPISKNHVCWKRDGKLYELYFRIDGRTPLLFRAPADSPVDEKSGYRELDAAGAVTGVFHIKEAIKQLTGKSPAQIGITMPPDRGAPKARTAAKTAEGKEAKPRKKREGLSGLDAAAQVLAKAKEPLDAKAIAARGVRLALPLALIEIRFRVHRQAMHDRLERLVAVARVRQAHRGQRGEARRGPQVSVRRRSVRDRRSASRRAAAKAPGARRDVPRSSQRSACAGKGRR